MNKYKVRMKTGGSYITEDKEVILEDIVEVEADGFTISDKDNILRFFYFNPENKRKRVVHVFRCWEYVTTEEEVNGSI